MLAYHTPVLLQASITGLAIRPEGTYVDATFGAGGHSHAILDQLGPNGLLIGFDKDEDAAANEIPDPRFRLVNHDYAYITNFLQYLGVAPVDGILADLGVASHHLETPERGFTYRADAPLDMRMDRENSLTAAIILNTYPLEELKNIFGQYGEVKNAKQVASAIEAQRRQKAIETTGDLTAILQDTIHGQDKRNRYLSQVFQALRIAVNGELENLKTFLEATPALLKPHGRLVVITYHSLEDRIVKHFIRAGNFRGKPEKDLYGQVNAPLQPVNRKPETPAEEEIQANSRARSAKLRIAEKPEV